MGCSPGDNECESDEKPAHPVTISRGFWLGKTEVTVEAYRRFAKALGRRMPDRSGGDDRLPIVNVSWDDAKAYCEWAGGRLPTEAEWEYAARAGSTTARYGPLDQIAWHRNNSRGRAHPVGEKQSNRFGLYDVLGNVWEWVADRSSDYRAAVAAGVPIRETRFLRSASWASIPRLARASYRVRDDVPGKRATDIGFRCVAE
jgi:formylglycine-generating enzyme required for sulfatase activity